jgi:exosortase/archaeosortase family protein
MVLRESATLIQPPAPRLPLLRIAAVFLAVFVALHVAYSAARGTWIERLVIDEATVRPAAHLVGTLDPALEARADGHSIRAAGSSLNVLNGCEGTETMFLMIAAFAAAPLPWRARLLGGLSSLAFVYALNQARIVTLFFAARHDRSLFDLLHGTVLPIVIVGAAMLFFLFWLSRGTRRDHADGRAA